MTTKVTMPQLGESVVEGTIGNWLVEEGQRVEKDQPLVEILTDKADNELPAPVAGVVTSIAARTDDIVAVGGEICTIDEAAEASAPAPAAAAPAPSAGTGEVATVTMPALGESVVEGTVGSWLVKAGDAVSVDQPLVEILTDKADNELPSPHAGVVTRLLAQTDDVVAVGGPLCEIAVGAPAGAAAPAPAAVAAPSAAAGSE
ncbi:MAG: biotin/lipoyl-containing protein, partial [Myxococcota bacterium]